MTPLAGQIPLFESLVATLWAKVCPHKRAELAGSILRESSAASPAVTREALVILEGLALREG